MSTGKAKAAVAPLSGHYDAIVVGAGMAGMAAAQKLRAAGLNALVVEARNRVGGRCFTNNSFPAPFDYGAQLFHQVTPSKVDPGATHNPLFDIATSLGVEVKPVVGPAFIQDGVPVKAAKSGPITIMYGLISTLIEEAGEEAKAAGDDESAAEATREVAKKRWFNLAMGLFALQFGVSPDEISARDIYRFSTLDGELGGKPYEYTVPSGMGNFVRRFADGLNVRLGVSVETIAWDGPKRVEVSTSGGKVTADAVIVTVPVALLQQGRPRFLPDLPAAHWSAIQNIRMGVVDKIGLRFSENVFGDLPASTPCLKYADDAILRMAICKFAGQNMANMFVNGEQAERLEAMGKDALVDYAGELIGDLFGSSARQKIAGGIVNPWGSDPWAGGSFPIALPHHANAHRQLAKPLGRLHFAGDATSELSYGTLVGAYATGRAAAARIAAAR